MTVQDVGRIDQFMDHIRLCSDLLGKTKEGWAYSNIYQMVLDLAEPQMAELELPDGFKPMALKRCFDNARQLVMDNPDLTYCEGYALTNFFPLPHAWVETADGLIIDPTWCNFATEGIYLGIRFATDFVLRRSLQTGWSSILDDIPTGAHVPRLLQHGLQFHDGIATDLKEHS